MCELRLRGRSQATNEHVCRHRNRHSFGQETTAQQRSNNAVTYTLKIFHANLQWILLPRVRTVRSFVATTASTLAKKRRMPPSLWWMHIVREQRAFSQTAKISRREVNISLPIRRRDAEYLQNLQRGMIWFALQQHFLISDAVALLGEDFTPRDNQCASCGWIKRTQHRMRTRSECRSECVIA